METSPVIDVSGLHNHAMDHRSSIWWGNLLMILIETTAFALMVASYFYLRGNYSQWPPPQSNHPLGLFDPVPDLFLPTISLGVLVLSGIAMAFTDRAALRKSEAGVTWGLAITILISAAVIVLRFYEFRAFKFRWDDNAYASVVWTTVCMHLLHLFIGTLENLTMFAWVAAKGLDVKHARDVHVTAIYWYWVVGIWILLYAILIPGPRFF